MRDNQFKPAWWLRNSHLQTIWPVLCRRDIKDLPLERERIELPDGDFIDLDWLCEKNEGPLVMILHGLEGSIDSHYAKGMLKAVCAKGWRAVFMHFRGCSGEHNRLPRSYHSGDTNDVSYIVKLLLRREPNTVLAGIGFSLGGNVLLKWLGETGKKNPLKAAIAVSVPFELSKAATRIQKGFSRFYQWYFIKCLCDRLTHKFQSADHPPIDPSVLSSVSTMFEFDDKITAPLHGFTGVDEYYAVASSRQYLRGIQVPTLIVQSKDDPFMSADIIPDPTEVSQYVQLEVTENGGHVGFVSGRYPWSPTYWLEERIPSYLEEVLK